MSAMQRGDNRFIPRARLVVRNRSPLKGQRTRREDSNETALMAMSSFGSLM